MIKLRKRTAGAAFAGAALVCGAVFTPVAAFAAPAETDQPTESTDVGTQAAGVATTQSHYTPAETAENGVPYTGTGFLAEVAFIAEISTDGGETWQEVTGQAQVADENGGVAGAVVLREGGVQAPFPEGEYKIRISQTPEDGDPVSAETEIFVVSEEAPEPTETEDPEPTETEDPEPTDTETPAPVEATLGVEKDTYTPAETVDGVDYIGQGFAPSTAFTLSVRAAGEDEWQVVDNVDDNEQVTDGEGIASGSLHYYVNEIASEFPEGDYEIRVSQEIDGETIEAVAAFTVAEEGGEEPVPTETDEPTPTETDDTKPTQTDDEGKGDDELAQTGADSALPVFLGGGLVLMAAGAGLYFVRRRAELS